MRHEIGLPRCAILLFAILLAGCGRVGKSDAGSAGAAAPTRGALLQTAPELLSTISALLLLLELNASPNHTAASAALLVPTGLGANCSGARPIVLCAHGTTTDRTFNMANVQGIRQRHRGSRPTRPCGPSSQTRIQN